MKIVSFSSSVSKYTNVWITSLPRFHFLLDDTKWEMLFHLNSKPSAEILSRTFFKINSLIILLYDIVLVLPYIDMNLPRVYMCSPS